MSRTPAGTRALRALSEAGVPHTVHAYTPDAHSELSYGLEAAAALDVDPARVFKTLVAAVDGALVLAVVPVSGQLDLKALAAAVGGKRATMAERAAAERATGYVAGGISPLGQRHPHTVVLDESAMDQATILISAGRRGTDAALAPADLVALTGAVTAAVGRP